MVKEQIASVIGRLRLSSWFVVLPTLLIVALVLVLSQRTAAPETIPPRNLESQVLFQEDQPLCESCHPDAYAAWQGTHHARATLDPLFQAQLAQSPDQQTCLACHTTGFNTGSGSFLGEGVTCEACHGPYLEGHPAAETMNRPMDSETCRFCHMDTFEQWESGRHAASGIECFHCHRAHDQGLRTGSEATLCAVCHADHQTEYAHALHGISGEKCAGCHMAEERVRGMPVSDVQVRNHNFRVASDTCAGCHRDTFHTVNNLPDLREAVSALDPDQRQEWAELVPLLADRVDELEKQLAAQRNTDIAIMGLSLGFGSFVGLVGGVVIMSLRRKGQS